MTYIPLPKPVRGRRKAAVFAACSFAAASLVIAACAGGSSSGPAAATASPASASTALPAALTPQLSAAPSPDPRVGLRPGWFDAATASWNMELISTSRPAPAFQNPADNAESRIKSSDLAFTGNLVYQGNYSGWTAWDVSNPRQPRIVQTYVCPGTQSDVSVFRNLLFVSHEATAGRVDCGLDPVQDTVSADRARGVRVIDISDPANPKRLTMVQTCRGSHTHTLLTPTNDPNNVYIYVSGSSGIRPAAELPGCSRGTVAENPNTAEFRIEVIQVPLANPAQARIVTSPRIFTDLTAAPGRAQGDAPAGGAAPAAGRAGAGGGAAGGVGAAPAAAGGGRGAGGGGGGRAGGAGATTPRPGPTQCHDITVYPAIGLGGGACGGYGILIDVSNPQNPRRLTAVADTNMSTWHSVTFNNDGTKILFSDEWGGGTNPRCRAGDRMEWGADAIYTLENNRMTPQSYYKMPAAQTEIENCVAHNGSLIPIPGRDVMVQAWYQGGTSIFDFTDPRRPKEIAFFDRGPQNPDRLVASGHWSSYWYNGYIYSSEEFRGLDIFELRPSPFISQNEIEAAKSVRLEQMNPQDQPKFVWPASFALARSYLDQLARGNGIARTRAEAISRELQTAESQSGAQRRAALTALATALDGDARTATDAARVRMMATAVRDLATATR